jgi:hypothetical protein
MLGGGPRGSPVSTQDRLLSILPYFVPLLDSLSFGSFFFKRVPLAGSLVLAPLYPIYSIYRCVLSTGSTSFLFQHPVFQGRL